MPRCLKKPSNMAKKETTKKQTVKKSTSKVSKKTAAKKVVKKTARKTTKTKSSAPKKSSSDKQKATRKTTSQTELMDDGGEVTIGIRKPTEKTTTTSESVSIDTAKTTTAARKRLNSMPWQRLHEVLSMESLDPVMIKVARVFGMFFIAAGGVLSLFTFQTAGSTTPMLLTSNLVESSLIEEDTSTTTSSTDNTTTTDSTVNEPVSDPEPIVSFAVNPDGTPITGSVAITVNVEHAIEVRVYAHDLNGGNLAEIGKAAQHASDSWTIEWNTKLYPNGSYSLKALVKNSHGTYDSHSLFDLEVFNEENAQSEVLNTDTVSFSIEDRQTIDSVFEFVVTAPGFERVVVYAVSKETDEKFRISATSFTGDGQWMFVWDTRETLDGEYKLSANLFIGTTIETVDGPRINILNDPDTETVTDSELNTDTTTSEATIEKDETGNVEKPRIELRLPSETILSGEVEFEVRPDDIEPTRSIQVEFVELYYKNALSAVPQFLGLVNKVAEDRGTFMLNTKSLPNGFYSFYARAKFSDGSLVTSNLVSKRIFNDTSVAAETSTEAHAELDKIQNEITRTSDQIEFVDGTEEEVSSSSTDAENADTTAVGQLAKKAAMALLLQFKAEVDEEVQRFTSAVRSGDEEQIQRAKNRLQALREKIVNVALDNENTREILSLIDEHIEFEFAKIVTRVKIIEDVVSERTNEAINKDSDNDGITDYDELKIYNTNPYLADSDNDGFIDSVEILGGFDPNDPSPEAMVSYESPKDNGIERQDLLVVESIKGVPEEDNRNDGVSAQAIISGKALPNSFVTLYIFSTPIIITVKTEADGSFAYRFDKELEDGSHEVYVGLTDNSGAVVAKSSPFAFVKRAEAFTPIEAATTAPVSPTPPTLATNNNIALLLLLGVVGIGMLLLILGMYMDRRKLNVTEAAIVAP